MADPSSEHAAAELAALRVRLNALEKSDLVDLAVQLSQTYVIEALGTLSSATADAAPAKGYDNVGDETFAGMIKRLKTARPGDEILAKFIVNGEHIQVRTPMGNVDVTEYRRPTAPAPAARPVGPAAAAPAPSVPANRDSIYNRELYQEPGAQPGARGGAPNPPAARPAAPANGPAPANPPAPAQNPSRPGPAPQPAAKTDKSEEEKKTGQRIRMIELD